MTPTHALLRVIGPSSLDDLASEAACYLQTYLGRATLHQMGPCQHVRILGDVEDFEVLDEAQGYLLARPLSSHALEEWLATRHEHEADINQQVVP